MVGRLSTMAVIASPDTSVGSTPPMPLTIGFTAMRTGYLNSSLLSPTPLVRAVTTYCLGSSSSSVARSTRIMPAVPITISGSGRCLNRSTTLPRLHDASAYSGLNRPPTLQFVHR